MITNEDIKKYLKQKYGFFAKNTWIAHAKETYGLPTKKSPLRKGDKRKWPCPPKRLEHIKEAFVHFGMLKD